MTLRRHFTIKIYSLSHEMKYDLYISCHKDIVSYILPKKSFNDCLISLENQKNVNLQKEKCCLEWWMIAYNGYNLRSFSTEINY